VPSRALTANPIRPAIRPLHLPPPNLYGRITERAIEYLRIRINAQNPQQQFHSVIVGALIDRFMKEYAPKHCRLNTLNCYRWTFNKHVRPKWGREVVQNIETMAVQDWLDEYQCSRQVTGHIREYMHTLFNQAIRWKMVDKNPITLAR